MKTKSLSIAFFVFPVFKPISFAYSNSPESRAVVKKKSLLFAELPCARDENFLSLNAFSIIL